MEIKYHTERDKKPYAFTSQEACELFETGKFSEVESNNIVGCKSTVIAILTGKKCVIPPKAAPIVTIKQPSLSLLEEKKVAAPGITDTTEKTVVNWG